MPSAPDGPSEESPLKAPLATYITSWSPAPVTDTGPLHAEPVAALSAVLDLPGPVAKAGDPLPPLWHWLHFLRWPAQADLGADGHPRHGHFLPPVPNRRRMFAGGRCRIDAPLLLGEPAECTASLASVTVKHGRTGDLLFVTERREFRQRGHACLVEEQDIVYRSGEGTARHPHQVNDAPVPESEDPWQLTLQPTPALLFRMSALTANAHRIHYDEPYCRSEEGYPGLVVHGPLLALLMLELPRRHAPERPVRDLAYRLQAPIFAGEHLAAHGTPLDTNAVLRIATHRTSEHATGTVTFA